VGEVMKNLHNTTQLRHRRTQTVLQDKKRERDLGTFLSLFPLPELALGGLAEYDASCLINFPWFLEASSFFCLQQQHHHTWGC